MLGIGYIYGHLLFAAISLTIAFAFAISALRIPGFRTDAWNAALYATSTATGLTGLWMASSGSLAAARAFFGAVGILFMLVTAGAHAQYAGLVLTPPERRRHLWQVIAYLLVGALVGDRHPDRPVRSRPHGHQPGVGRQCHDAAALVVEGVRADRLLPRQHSDQRAAAPGRRAARVRAAHVAVAMLATPAVVLWELSIAVGLNHLLPVAGYFAGLLGLHGALVLIERFRNLSESGGVLGGFVIERRIGGGGMADVFLGYRKLEGPLQGVVRRAAVKRLRAEYAEDPNFVRMFLAEARTASRLSHPNIVKLYDAGTHKDQLFLAMELVDGASLAQLFHALTRAERRLSLDAVVEIATQLSDALDYVHALRDDDGTPAADGPSRRLAAEHPRRPQGLVKLADFGIARSADHSRHTEAGVLKGKISYMALEQIRGESYDHRVDLYAAGVILFELATGHRLHEGRSEPALLFSLLKGETPPLDRLGEVTAPLAT